MLAVESSRALIHTADLVLPSSPWTCILRLPLTPSICSLRPYVGHLYHLPLPPHEETMLPPSKLGLHIPPPLALLTCSLVKIPPLNLRTVQRLGDGSIKHLIVTGVQFPEPHKNA